MTFSLPMRRKPRSPGRAPLAFVGAALLAELLLAGSVVSDRLAPLMMLAVGAVGWAAMVRWPLVGMGRLFLLTGTFLPCDFLQGQVGPAAGRHHAPVALRAVA